jgi:transposase
MRAETQPIPASAATEAEPATILVSFELSQANWVLTVLSPGGEKLSRHGIKAADTARALLVLETHRCRAERKRGAPVKIVTIQEAGLDGFWVHRWLEANGIESHVVDAGSIAAPRRKRRAKSDGIDGETLLRVLAAWRRGEPRVCSMVVPPGVEDEDRRRLSRERDELLRERTTLTNRINGLLASQGIRDYQPMKRDRRRALEQLRTGDGRELPAHLTAGILRALDRLEALLTQIKAVEAERDALLEADGGDETAITTLLAKLRGIGPEFTSVLVLECLWRHFGNRRQLAAFAGLAPTPWRSGGIDHEQGISGAGNPRLRRTLIEMAWLWLRYQPGSALSQWFQARAREATGRVRRITIVALARKLLVALWRYVHDGVVPEGAVFKPA